MVQILDGKLIREDITNTAMGGTELIATNMIKYINPELLQGFQIIHSRVTDLDFSKKRILVLHDLAQDPMNKHLEAGGYNKFDKLVFVSNWQMQKFIDFYDIPWYKCCVIKNAIEPVELSKPVEGKIRLIYHTTPHRGLDILLSVYDKLLDNNKDLDITLDVFSSFKIYGWEQRDKEFETLFDFCRKHEKINYHGTVSNEEVKKAVSNSDIFAYPSIWQESSCISLMEAMSAGIMSVHSNLGALFETSAGWTAMYQYESNKRDHAKIFYNYLNGVVDKISRNWSEELGRSEELDNHLSNQSYYANSMYNWQSRKLEWETLLKSIKL